MTVADLIVHLRTLGVELYRNGDKLTFDAPKGVLRDDLLEQLRENKEEVLAYLAPETVNAENNSGPKPYPRTNNIPLCGNQKRLWFLDQLAPGDVSYNIPLCVRLTGPVKINELERALNIVLRRHEVFRLGVSNQQGVPVLRIADSVWVTLEEIAAAASSDQKTAFDNAMARVKGLASTPFDLDAPPLFRTALYRLDENDYIFAFITHHFLADGWSIGVFYRELSTLYNGFLDDTPASLPQLPLQYIDVALWQDEQVKSRLLKDQLDFWKQELAGVPQVLDFPYDGLRRQTANGAGNRIEFEIEPTMAKELRELSRRHAKTLFSFLLSVFQALLFRYSGQEVLTVGTAASNRNCKESENLIGFFANNLPLVARFEQDLPFLEFLEVNSKTIYNAFANQDIPFDKLVDTIDPDRDLNKSPIFQFLFLLHNHSVESSFKLPKLKTEKISLDLGSSMHDMDLVMEDTGTRIAGTVTFRADVLSTGFVERICVHYLNLLADITKQPEQKISRLEYLGNLERKQILFDWNATEAAYPKDQSIQQLFEARVVRTPEAVAVVHEGRQLSYAELNARANRLAHYLIEQGVEPDTLVALCLERSLDLVVAVLGILKAGGAYVPLDPGYPQERLAFMLADTRAPVLITQSSLQAVLSSHDATVLCLDNADDPLAGYAGENPAVRSQPHHLAYINYTSGSTGQPKGVCIPHQAVTRLVFGANYVSLDADKTLLHMAPISFDAATFELWGALLHGGRCVLYPEPVPTPEGLKAVIAEQGVDTLWLTTAFFNVVVDTDVEILSDVQQVLTGGEALSVSHIRKALQQLKSTQLVNGYGPTESTTFTCCYSIPDTLDSPLSSIPIGRPISNTQVYILDTHLKPVPIGVVGELYIGGDGLARGYLNRPELTAECFIPNPLAGTPGERLYRTGDRVRYLADSNIEFMGRSDDQVKIRGFRIEPGEIEATLKRHPQVQDSLVLVRDEAAGGKRLVAYVLTGQAADDFIATLRGYLRETLPEYMVPSAFITLDAFPLTPNGKVDRKTLSAMDLVQPLETEYVAPRTSIEEELATIWCELLQLDRVGVHDNFFHLGGHSLLATKAISRMNTVLHAEFPLMMFFECSTIAEQASRIVQEQTDSIDEDLEGLMDELEELSEVEQAAIVFEKQGITRE